VTTELIEIGSAKEVLDKYIHHRPGAPLEEARMFEELLSVMEFQTEVAKFCEVSPGYVSKRLQLLKLIPELQDMLREGKMKASTAYVLSKLSEDVQREYLDEDYITLKESKTRSRSIKITQRMKDAMAIGESLEEHSHHYVCVHCGSVYKNKQKDE